MRWINREPGAAGRLALAALPFALVAMAYSAGSAARLAENPQDRILPAPSTLFDTAVRLMTEPDRRSGDVLFWGDTAKVALIAIGITPFLIRDLSARTMELPQEQIVKAQTLGASSLAIVLSVALPQIMPRLISAVRLSLGPAWLFLIAAEAVASDSGLGYRIFLVRRFLAMDVILTYVAWITFLAFMFDWGLARLSRWLYPWAEVRR
jgi:NitT/TauT family transport system permease protein